jgi:hypothetical protein
MADEWCESLLYDLGVRRQDIVHRKPFERLTAYFMDAAERDKLPAGFRLSEEERKMVPLIESGDMSCTLLAALAQGRALFPDNTSRLVEYVTHSAYVFILRHVRTTTLNASVGMEVARLMEKVYQMQQELEDLKSRVAALEAASHAPASVPDDAGTAAVSADVAAHVDV